MIKCLPLVKGFILAWCLCLALAFSACAAETQEANTVYVDLTQGNIIYDEELGADLIPFTIDTGGTVNYLTEEEYVNSAGIKLGALSSANEQIATPSAYFLHYKFVKCSGPAVVNGPFVKLTPTLITPEGGGSITQTISTTVTEAFSANITRTAEKASVRGNAGITGGWQKSAANSTLYEVNLLPSQRGYIGFAPKYGHVEGVLAAYTNWGNALVGQKAVTGDSVKISSNGGADGTFAFIFE